MDHLLEHEKYIRSLKREEQRESAVMGWVSIIAGIVLVYSVTSFLWLH